MNQARGCDFVPVPAAYASLQELRTAAVGDIREGHPRTAAAAHAAAEDIPTAHPHTAAAADIPEEKRLCLRRLVVAHMFQSVLGHSVLRTDTLPVGHTEEQEPPLAPIVMHSKNFRPPGTLHKCSPLGKGWNCAERQFAGVLTKQNVMLHFKAQV
jgi:hypothetical protein